MLSATYPKKIFFACPHFPPWKPPSYSVEFTLSSACSRSDHPLFGRGAALDHLDPLPSYDLTI